MVGEEHQKTTPLIMSIEPEVNLKPTKPRLPEINRPVNVDKADRKPMGRQTGVLTTEPESKCTSSTESCPQAQEATSSVLQDSDETTTATRKQLDRLSEHQRQIIIETFAEMEHHAVKNGLKMLVKLFSEYPNYKQIWPQFRAIPDSSLMNAIALRRHASVYMCGLGAIIHSMKHENELALQMTRIAKAHIKWNVHRSHVVHMLDPVLDIVQECNPNYNNEMKQAWTTLYHIIADLIEIYRKKVFST
ncbi:unnamed protein product [Nippostrongylus brasiliensis]|uniref:GLOBIN domain-containing protein n=1 Tax=Nippostrongylus brasiliensis TaxID=27835 RepID=A0A0N4YFT6_NIPBR|nr:unnamed protein product [Nippostrongylus brasiliensis]